MHIQKIALFIFCSFFSFASTAQISATSGPVSACAPANITFTAPAGASNISWTFGPFPPSSSASGGFTALNPGTFTATFNGIVSGSPVTFSVPVTLNPKPTANFNILQPNNSCAIKTVTLVNQSAGAAPIVNWLWVYGDGGLNSFTTGANHTYGYAAVGSFSVTLQVTDANGCDDQISKGTVNVISSPIAAISSNPPLLVGCLSNFSAAFSASNSVGSSLSYNWSFGNGQTSQAANAGPITYTSQTAQYAVSLTVTSSGCSHVATTYVTVSPASLSVALPPTVCVNALATATINSNQPYSTWNMGNSNVFVLANPVPGTTTISLPPYFNPGVYTVVINAGSSPCVAAPVTRTVLVDQVVANFAGSTPTVSCSSPFLVSYTNTSSSNATQFQWNYLAENSVTATSTGSATTFTLSHGSLNQYAIYNRAFTPTITLVATSAAGCMASITKTVHSIERPSAWFNTDKKEGCVPLTVSFRDSSILFPSCPIVSYTWCNGASPPVFVTGTLGLPPATNTRIPWQTFVYNVTGTYTPYLIIETASNYTNTSMTCIDISFLDRIIVADPPVLTFSVPSGPFCHTDTIQIVNTSPTMNDVQHWHVDSDNGFFSGCVSNPNPKWKFTNAGTFNFTLTGYQNSCANTAFAGPVTIEGPICSARYETNCDVNRSSVNFTVELQEVQTATLNFGDGTQTTFTGNINPAAVIFSTTNHIYAASGDYTATLTANNPGTGCANSTYTMLVTVRDVQANMVSSPTVCAGNPIQFNSSASVDVLTGCARGYAWFVDDLPPIETVVANYTHTFTASGIHTVIMVVKDVNSCVDTLKQTVRVSSVTPAFSLSSNTICLSTGTVQLTNTTLQVPDSIVNYFWNFGNGSIFSTSSIAVPIATYNNANVPSSSYTISLIATNKLGCTYSVTETLSVIKPQVYFLPSQFDFCVTESAATTVSFTPQFPYNTYTINYGTGATSTAVTSGVSSYTYNLPGTYTIDTRVRTAAGCENTGSFVINAVQTPTADFIFSSPNSTGGNNICSGRVVSFTNISTPQQHIPTWDLGSGILPNTSNTVSLFFSAPSTSVIAISLTVNTGAPAFCKATTSDNFTIYVYNGDFIASDSIVCRGETLTFSITPDSKGLGAWLWSYGDATSSTTLTPPASSITSHVYSNYTATAAGYTSVSLIFWSGDMACKDGVDKLIKVINVEPDFKRNNELLKIDTAHCINIVDNFSNLTTSNSSALTYTWSFGDGNGTVTESPSHLYTSAGVYSVYLRARDENRCEVTVSKRMIIFPLPTATIVPRIEGYCPDVPFNLSMQGSAGVNSGTWAPAANISGAVNFTTETAAHTAEAIAASTINYSVTVTNSNNCVSLPVDTVITIVQPPISREWDTTVVIGEEIPINVVLSERFTYTWTPITEDLSCTSCLDPVSTSTVDIVYTLVMEDELRCKEVSSTYSVFILPKATVDLPTAFSPNGDGKNDIIYVDGWGIKKLNYLRIYNRWGQMLFESNDLSIGWDGTYNGIPQNVETYVYQVSVETYVDVEPLLKTASFKLIR